VLACPSATELDGIAACLLDVDDEERLRRLTARDDGRWDAAARAAFVQWGRWHRAHAADPRARPEVITTRGSPAMRWHRWHAWTRTDPRWHTHVLDTTRRAEADTAAEITAWIGHGRDTLAAGTLTLAKGWQITDAAGWR
jgi:hypothetical protein